MTTFIRGKSGIIDMLVARRNTLANRLLNDDKRQDVSHMTKTERVQIQAEINGMNGLIIYLVSDDVTLLSETEYDAMQARFAAAPGPG